MLTATGARAQEVLEDTCFQAELDVKTYLRVMQSCSDAYWDRGDLGEADALCAAARSLTERNNSSILAQLDIAKSKDAPTSECARRRVLPLLGLLVKASDWQLAFLRHRQNGRDTPEPAPLEIVRFADPAGER